jgi:hypothetical protein
MRCRVNIEKPGMLTVMEDKILLENELEATGLVIPVFIHCSFVI